MAEPGAPLRAIDVEKLPDPVRERVLGVLGEALQARGVLGRLYDPAPQAEALLELSPSARYVVISIERCQLDARAFTACDTLQHVCSRRPQGRPPRCFEDHPAVRAGDVVDAIAP